VQAGEAEEQPAIAPVPAWRRFLPFVVAAALLAWVLVGIDWGEFADALTRVNILAFTAFGLVFMLALLLADAFAIAGVYRATVGSVTTTDIFVIRGASYLPTFLNYHVGVAWMTWFVAKVMRTSLWRMSGVTLIVYATTFGALYAFGVVGAVLAGDRIPGLLPPIIGIGIAAIGYLAVLAWKPKALAERRLLAPLFETGVGGQLVLFARRLPHVGVLFVGTWVPFELFHIHIPTAEAFALIPVLMFVLALPLSPQGFGTRDAAAVLLFSGLHGGDPDAAHSAIAACTLSMGVLYTLFQLPLSLVLMSIARKRYGQPG
jgi:hypothetical protein